MFLKGESEMIHLLTYILTEEYNNNFDALNGQSPMQLFNKQESDHKAKLTDAEVAYGTLEGHRCTVVGCGVAIEKGDYMFLYKKRTPEIARKFFRRPVDVFVDPLQPKADAYIFSKGINKFLLKMPNINIVPCSAFDRTQADRDFIKGYNKDTRELIDEFEEYFKTAERTAETLLDGIDYKESSKAAKIKKKADGAFLQTQIGLTEAKPEPPHHLSNSLSKLTTKKKKIKKTAEEALAEKYGL